MCGFLTAGAGTHATTIVYIAIDAASIRPRRSTVAPRRPTDWFGSLGPPRPFRLNAQTEFNQFALIFVAVQR